MNDLTQSPLGNAVHISINRNQALEMKRQLRVFFHHLKLRMIDDFRKRFVEFYNETSVGKDLSPKVYIDAEVELGDLSLNFLQSYELLQPFGSGNAQPIFMARRVWLTEPPRRLKNNHLRLFLRQGYEERDAIFFGGGANDLPDPPWDVTFTVDRNVFRGRVSVQISIQHVRAASDDCE